MINEATTDYENQMTVGNDNQTDQEYKLQMQLEVAEEARIKELLTQDEMTEDKKIILGYFADNIVEDIENLANLGNKELPDDVRIQILNKLIEKSEEDMING